MAAVFEFNRADVDYHLSRKRNLGGATGSSGSFLCDCFFFFLFFSFFFSGFR